jgi:hypothetical protein
LKIDLENNNERQTVKFIQCVWGTCGRGRGNEGDEGEGIRLMDFIYICKIEQ